MERRVYSGFTEKQRILSSSASVSSAISAFKTSARLKAIFMESFEARLVLPCSVDDVFDLVARPEGIKKITPPEMGLYFTSAPERYVMDSRIEFKIQAMGLVREIVHQVTVFDEPRSFTEEQIAGPFKKWIHEHIFETQEGGGSVVIDRIQFLPPGGVAGMIMNASRILDNLEDGFDFRHEQLERHFQSTSDS